MVIEHAALPSERIEHVVDISPTDELEITNNTGIVHRKDIEPTEST